MNKVVEIQVGGSVLVRTLGEACWEYVKLVGYPEQPMREKIHFVIEVDGELKSITIRDTDDGTVAYGDFGLQSFIEFAKESLKEVGDAS